MGMQSGLCFVGHFVTCMGMAMLPESQCHSHGAVEAFAALQCMRLMSVQSIHECPGGACVRYISSIYTCRLRLVCMAQALLDEWRVEVARKPLAMSEERACKVLGLSPGGDGVVAEEDLKFAYRSLARKCVSRPL